MNTQELIVALQQLDPNTSAGDAVALVRQQQRDRRMKALGTKEGIVAEYPKILARITETVDSKGNKNDPTGYRLETFNALRTEVHEALMFFNPMPSATELEKNFTSIPNKKAKTAAVNEVQKAHSVELWERTDELIAQAGITAEGGV